MIMIQENQNASVYENYLRDLGFLIKEMAIESCRSAKETHSDFATGYMAGFHRVVSLMQQQAEAFNIPLEKLRLDGIDPNIDLV
jgi:hypothetical protein